MSSPNSPTLNEVIENIVEDVLRERVEQPESHENVPAREVREETKEVKVNQEKRESSSPTRGQRFSGKKKKPSPRRDSSKKEGSRN